MNLIFLFLVLVHGSFQLYASELTDKEVGPLVSVCLKEASAQKKVTLIQLSYPLSQEEQAQLQNLPKKGRIPFLSKVYKPRYLRTISKGLDLKLQGYKFEASTHLYMPAIGIAFVEANYESAIELANLPEVGEISVNLDVKQDPGHVPSVTDCILQ